MFDAIKERQKREHEQRAWVCAQIMSSGLGQLKRAHRFKDTFRRLCGDEQTSDEMPKDGKSLRQQRKEYFARQRKQGNK